MHGETERKKVRVMVKSEILDRLSVLERESNIYLVSSTSTSRLSAFKGHY